MEIKQDPEKEFRASIVRNNDFVKGLEMFRREYSFQLKDVNSSEERVVFTNYLKKENPLWLCIPYDIKNIKFFLISFGFEVMNMEEQELTNKYYNYITEFILPINQQ